jgi:hypothetical protein
MTSAPYTEMSLTEFAKVVFAMSDFANRRAAIDMNLAHLAGAKAQGRVSTVTRRELGATTGRANQLAAFAGLHLHVVHRGTDRDAAQWQRIAGLDRRVFTADDRRTCLETFGRENVTALAIGIFDQCNVRAAVRIVLEPLDNAGNAVLVALEINKAIKLLVPAALVTHRDMAIVVSPTRTGLRFDQRGVRLAFVQARRLDSNLESASG